MVMMIMLEDEVVVAVKLLKKFEEAVEVKR